MTGEGAVFIFAADSSVSTAVNSAVLKIGDDVTAGKIILTAVDDIQSAAAFTADKGMVTVNGSVGTITVASAAEVDIAELTPTGEGTIVVNSRGALVFVLNLGGPAADGIENIKLATSVELGNSATVLAGSTLTIGEGVTLTVPDNTNILTVNDGASLAFADGTSSSVLLKGAESNGAKIVLGSTQYKNTVIAAAGTVTAEAAVTDVSLTVSGGTATLTIAAANADDTSVNGASTAKEESTDAAITCGTNKDADIAATGTFASETVVGADDTAVIPAAGGFGAGVTISGGKITVDETNGAYGE